MGTSLPATMGVIVGPYIVRLKSFDAVEEGPIVGFYVNDFKGNRCRNCVAAVVNFSIKLIVGTHSLPDWKKCSNAGLLLAPHQLVYLTHRQTHSPTLILCRCLGSDLHRRLSTWIVRHLAVPLC